MFRALVLLLGFSLASPIEAWAASETAAPPLRSDWNGFVRLDFTVAGRPCILMQPREAAPGRPWIWRTEFFGHEPQADLALLARGWHVAYMDAKNLYGAPKALAWFGEFHAHLVAHFQLSRRVVLEGFSRGGLYAVNYAAAHPADVAALYLDAPVLDIRSWPGRKRDSKEWRECLAAYGITEEQLPAFKLNPIDQIGALTSARIPVLVVCGDTDTVVPIAENTRVLEQRYRAAGAPIEVIVKPGGDHHPHSLKDPAPIVEFLLKNARF